MSDSGRSGDAGPQVDGGAVGEDAPSLARPIERAAIDDLLNDPAMTIGERRARLEALAGELGERGRIELGGEVQPLEARIGEALSLLAEGGHAYGTPETGGLASGGGADIVATDDEPDI